MRLHGGRPGRCRSATARGSQPSSRFSRNSSRERRSSRSGAELSGLLDQRQRLLPQAAALAIKRPTGQGQVVGTGVEPGSPRRRFDRLVQPAEPLQNPGLVAPAAGKIRLEKQRPRDRFGGGLEPAAGFQHACEHGPGLGEVRLARERAAQQPFGGLQPALHEVQLAEVIGTERMIELEGQHPLVGGAGVLDLAQGLVGDPRFRCPAGNSGARATARRYMPLASATRPASSAALPAPTSACASCVQSRSAGGLAGWKALSKFFNMECRTLDTCLSPLSRPVPGDGAHAGRGRPAPAPHPSGDPVPWRYSRAVRCQGCLRDPASSTSREPAATGFIPACPGCAGRRPRAPPGPARRPEGPSRRSLYEAGTVGPELAPFLQLCTITLASLRLQAHLVAPGPCQGGKGLMKYTGLGAGPSSSPPWGTSGRACWCSCRCTWTRCRASPRRGTWKAC